MVCKKEQLCKLKDNTRFIQIIFISFLSGSFASITYIWIFSHFFNPQMKMLNDSDAISVANTFIVFTTFLVAVAAVGITIYGIFVSKKASEEKATIIRENIDKVVHTILDQEHLEKFIDSLIKSESFIGRLSKHIANLKEKNESIENTDELHSIKEVNNG